MTDDDEMDEAVAKSTAELTRQSPLADQARVLTRADRELRLRLRFEELDIREKWQRALLENELTFKRAVEDALSTLEMQRREADAQADDEARASLAINATLVAKLAR